MQLLKGHDGVIHTILFSPDGELLVSSGKDGTVRTWDVAGGSTVHLTSHEQYQSFAFSSDGRHLALGSAEGGLMVWNMAERTLAASQRVEGPVSGLAFLQDDRTVVFALGTPAKETEVTAGSIRFWDWRDNRFRPLLADIAPTIAVRGLAFLPAHRLMAWATRNNLLTV